MDHDLAPALARVLLQDTHAASSLSQLPPRYGLMKVAFIGRNMGKEILPRILSVPVTPCHLMLRRIPVGQASYHGLKVKLRKSLIKYSSCLFRTIPGCVNDMRRRSKRSRKRSIRRSRRRKRYVKKGGWRRRKVDDF